MIVTAKSMQFLKKMPHHIKEQSMFKSKKLLKRMKVSTLQLFKNLQREGSDNTSALITNTIILFSIYS